MSNLLTALLPVPGPAPGGSSKAGHGPALGSGAGQGSDLFKLQFGHALAAVAGGGNAPASGSAASPVSSTLDALEAKLEKKIGDLLAAGMSLTDIIQQLATSLANQFAAAFGGDPAQIRGQLQTAFATALSPPGNGPPASIAESASTLAQRFRQVAEAAARASGETGQSSRLFAGSISDAAPTAGVQPAPQPSQPTPSGFAPLAADSILTNAFAALVQTATVSPARSSPSDGPTVAFAQTGAPAIGSNGSTLLGRILTRAYVAQAGTPPPASLDAGTGPVRPAAAASSPDLAVPAIPVRAPSPWAAASLPSSPSVTSLFAATIAGGAPANPAGTPAPGAASPQLTAFLETFAKALAGVTGGNVTSGASDASAGTAVVGVKSADGVSSLLDSSDPSANAPTVSAFLPVQPPFHVGAASPDPTQPASVAPHVPVDPSSVVDQVLRGAFLQTDGTTSQVRLNLVPASLGDVSVTLNVSGGNVSAHLVAQTADARDALLAGQAQLTRQLADAGLKLTGFNVDLAGGFTSFQQQQQSNHPQSSGRRLAIAGIDAGAEDEASLLAAPSFGPPLLPNLNFGALNYLV